MPVRAPLVEANQDGSVCIQDLTKVVMARRRLGLAEERLVPFEAAGNVAYANDRPYAFHRIFAAGLMRRDGDKLRQSVVANTLNGARGNEAAGLRATGMGRPERVRLRGMKPNQPVRHRWAS